MCCFNFVGPYGADLVLAHEACEPLVPGLPGNICLPLSSKYPLNIKGLRQTRGDSLRLAPLYDLVCTVYYPELTDKMAMKIGGEARSARIYPRQIERFAAAAGLAATQTRARVSALTERLLEEIPGIEKPNPLSESVAALITERCNDFRLRFSRK